MLNPVNKKGWCSEDAPCPCRDILKGHIVEYLNLIETIKQWAANEIRISAGKLVIEISKIMEWILDNFS